MFYWARHRESQSDLRRGLVHPTLVPLGVLPWVSYSYGSPGWSRTNDAGVKVPCLSRLATGQYDDAPTYGRNLIPIRFGARGSKRRIPPRKPSSGFSFSRTDFTNILLTDLGLSTSFRQRFKFCNHLSRLQRNLLNSTLWHNVSAISKLMFYIIFS